MNYVAPGRWCLRCTGLVTARRLAFESLTTAERKKRIIAGYSDDLLLKQSAVMDLNMRAASSGMITLRHLLQPFLLEPLPVTLAENLVTYNLKPIASARCRNMLAIFAGQILSKDLAIAVSRSVFPPK
jgi:hypothetical protein